MSRLRVRIATAVVLAALAVVEIDAWGAQGHRLVALVATARLTPAAQQSVKWLLPDRSLADVAVWADDYRVDHSATAPWHFVNPPIEATTYDRDRDCPRQPGVTAGSRGDRWRDCVVDRILYARERLADGTLDRADRAAALKFLVHFVGDLHQPMHTFITGRGGNDIPVVFFGSPTCTSSTGDSYPCNLHGLWDTLLIARRNLTDQQYLQQLTRLIQDRKLDAMSGATPADWTAESLRLAKAAALQPKGVVDEAYYQKQIQVVDQRLAQGGIRLATALNEIFKTPPR